MHVCITCYIKLVGRKLNVKSHCIGFKLPVLQNRNDNINNNIVTGRHYLELLDEMKILNVFQQSQLYETLEVI